MAFDGITTACLRKEFSDRLTGARIYKIEQTDRDELVLTCQMDAEGLLRKWRTDAPELADTAKAIVRRIVDHCEPINFVWEDSPWE